MSFPSPNLDDRTHKDIVEEAKKKIPELCKSWTDFNPSDPGITLVELMAWMTEMMIYRLNQVPEKNYIKFLELIGVNLKPPESATSWILVKPASKASDEGLISIPAGTRVSTDRKKGDLIVFETTESLDLTTIPIVRMGSIYLHDKEKEIGEDLTNLINRIGGGGSAHLHEGSDGTRPIFAPIKKKGPPPHILFLGTSSIGKMREEDRLKCIFKVKIEVNETLSPLEISWEFWDGESWSPSQPNVDTTNGLMKSGEISFDPLPQMPPREIEGKHAQWLRARYLGGQDRPRITQVTKAVMLRPQYGLQPDSLYWKSAGNPYSEIELDDKFHPFGLEPESNNCFCIQSWVFGLKNTRIFLNVTLVKEDRIIRPLKDLKIEWQYRSRSGDWCSFKKEKPSVSNEEADLDFRDGTSGFSQNGKLTFICPDDCAPFDPIPGQKNYCIRALVIEANTYVPRVENVTLYFEEIYKEFSAILSYNYYFYKDLKQEDQGAIEPFQFTEKDDPTLYLSFGSRPKNKPYRIFFHFIGGETLETNPHAIVWEFLQSEKGGWQNLEKVEKEFQVDESSGSWKSLKVFHDSTNSMTQTGVIEFIAPADWQKTSYREESGYWLRARWVEGNFDHSAKLVGVSMNAVKVTQSVSHRNEVLGSSNGQAFQTFKFTHSPLLPDPKILVREFDKPSTQKIKELKKDLKDDIIEEVDPSTGRTLALWICWKEVENFFESESDSRHFTLDLRQGILTFGDGLGGMIPPIGRDNIKCEVYHVGGGARGNVASDTITVLNASHPGVESITNPTPAEGGADAQSIEEAKLSVPWELKHRNRAVTKEDFEWLAKKALSSVASAKCYVDDGEIKVVVIPKGESPKLQPGTELIRKVRDYLDQRRLITTKVRVMGPTYKDLFIRAKIVLVAQKFKRSILPQLEEDLRNFFHPTKGGPRNRGWPIGQAIHISEIYYLLEKSEEVDYVTVIEHSDRIGEERKKERIEMKNPVGEDHYLPYLKVVELTIAGE